MVRYANVISGAFADEGRANRNLIRNGKLRQVSKYSQGPFTELVVLFYRIHELVQCFSALVKFLKQSQLLRWYQLAGHCWCRHAIKLRANIIFRFIIHLREGREGRVRFLLLVQ